MSEQELHQKISQLKRQVAYYEEKEMSRIFSEKMTTSENDSLNDENIKLKSTISELKNDILDLQSQIKKLNTNIIDMERDNQDLQDELESYVVENKKIEDEQYVQKLKYEFEKQKLENDLDHTKSELHELQFKHAFNENEDRLKDIENRLTYLETQSRRYSFDY